MDLSLYFLEAGFMVKNMAQMGLNLSVSSSMVKVSFFCWIAVNTPLYYSVQTDRTG